VSAFAHHLALAAAIAALGAAGFRAASLATAEGGLARVVAGVVLAAAAGVAEALGLGLAGLGGSPVALTAAAVVTWLVVRRVVPARGPRAAEELRAWAGALDLPAALALGAAVGLAAAWTVWLFLHPALGHDMVLYHLPEAVQWVHSGHTGRIDPIITGVPVGSYPLTHEVVLEWGLAIGRSFVWATLATAMAPVLIALAGWLGLRALGVDRLVRTLAVAALVATPAVLAAQSGGATLDPAALAWLLCCAALCASARRQPGLLAPALVAAALAFGTKTTTGPLAVTVLVLGAWPLRGRLRAIARGLAAAAVLGVAVGGVWYLRNTLEHGWPLWPFSSVPWGDSRPPVIANADISFIDRPGTTVDRLGDYYLHHIGGPLLLFCGALAAALLARTRAVAGAALATLASVFIWMNAPFTGVVGSTRAFDIGTGDATRYLLPGAAAAALAVALAGRRDVRLRTASALLLAAGAAIGVRQSFALGFPNVPSATTPIAGALLGAAAAAALTRVGKGTVPFPARGRRFGVAVAAAAVLLAAGALGAVAGAGFVERHGRTGTRESPLAAWFADQRRWREGHEPVVSTWSLVATLAGDRLEHPLELAGAREACERGRAAGWLVVDRHEARLRRAGGCGVVPGYSDHDYQAYGPAQLRQAGASRLPAP
jgi:hypothetical protein